VSEASTVPAETPGRPDPAVGLSAAEVAERVAAGEVNAVPDSPSRTVGEIVRANVFTRFNALMTALAVAVLVAGSPRDALFFGVVIANTLIGSIQELRAKRTLDRLAVLSAPKAHVVRNGEVAELGVHEIVLDDVLDLRPGQQVSADGEVLTETSLEVDESLLTGESDAVAKQSGDPLLSGSFIVAGRGRARVTKVGADAYAARLAEEARRFTLVSSELRIAIDRIITWVSWLVVPAAIGLAISQHQTQPDWRDATVSAIGGVVAMVPEGLVLLTSVAFAVGVIRLASHHTLVQELPAIEVLARVDVVCLDKTGTITEGTMQVFDVQSLDGAPGDVYGAVAAVAHADPNPNATSQALLERYADDPGWTPNGTVPFSSARKWSAVSFDDHGCWVLGAPELVMADRFEAELRDRVGRAADDGQRVLVLAHSDAPLDGEHLPDGLAAAALVLLEDRIRVDAPDTLRYFAEQDVTLKVISGDNPRTVAAVAQRAGLVGADAAVDARTLPADDLDALAGAVDTSTVFGRVTPHQKRAMVQALQSKGHTVAMTGDGVNDVLALKDADCGIAMAAGSEASRAVAQLVLLDSSFAALPRVVAEGRRVINNIERVASLYLVKTVYSVLLALLVGIFVEPYPFLPRHLTLIGAITIGIPSFFLALAPNDERVHSGFIVRVARIAVPAGLVTGTLTFIAYAFARQNSSLSLAEQRTTAALVLCSIGLIVLLRIARPLNPLRLALVASMAGIFVLALLVPFVRDFFKLDTPDGGELAVAGLMVAISVPALEVATRIAARIPLQRLERETQTRQATGVSSSSR
jgi:cation-transporting ATPase E